MAQEVFGEDVEVNAEEQFKTALQNFAAAETDAARAAALVDAKAAVERIEEDSKRLEAEEQIEELEAQIGEGE